MKIFQVSRNTIYNWFNNSEKFSLVGLYNESSCGRKQIFNDRQQEKIQEWVKSTPKNLQLVQNKIHKKWGRKASKDTIERLIKSMNMEWYRLKK